MFYKKINLVHLVLIGLFLFSISDLFSMGDSVSNTTPILTSTTNVVSNQLNQSFYSDPTLENNREAESFTMLWVKLILVMTVFVGGCLLLMRFLKNRGQVAASNDNEMFETIAEYSLEVSKKIKIIRVVNDYFILALSQEQITLIKSVDDKETIDFLKLESGKVSNKKYFFSEMLNGYMSGKSNEKKSNLSVTSGLKDRLKKNLGT